MLTDHILSILLFSPLLGVLIIGVTSKSKTPFIQAMNVCVTLLPIAVLCMIWVLFDWDTLTAQFTAAIPWVHLGSQQSGFVISYVLGVDHLSLLLLSMMVLLFLLAAVLSRNLLQHVKAYAMILLLMESGMLGLLLARGLLFFIACLAIVMLLMFYLIVTWGYGRRLTAVWHFVTYNGVGILLLLLVAVALFVQTGTLNVTELQLLHYDQMQSLMHSLAFRRGLVFVLCAAFAVMMPVFPFHTWYIRLHDEAYLPVAMLFVCAWFIVIPYGILRFMLAIFPDIFADMTLVFITLGVVNALFAVVMLFLQKDGKRIVGYLGMIQGGIVFISFGVWEQGHFEVIVSLLMAHTLLFVLIFLFIYLVYQVWKTTHMHKLLRFLKVKPVLFIFIAIGCLSLLGVPGTLGFVSQYPIFMTAYQSGLYIALLGVLALVGCLIFFIRTLLYATSYRTVSLAYPVKFSVFTWLVLLVVSILLIGMGFFAEDVLAQFHLTFQTLLVGQEGSS